MNRLPEDALLEILLNLRPQENLNAFFCVSKILNKSLRRIVAQNQSLGGMFVNNHLLTPFQKDCLQKLVQNKITTVPDVDNALILIKALMFHLKADMPKIVFTESPEKMVRAFPYSAKFLYEPESLTYVKTRSIIFTDKPITLPDDCISHFMIVFSNETHPVDEYTPLWVYNCGGYIAAERVFDDDDEVQKPFIFPKNIDLKKSVMINKELPIPGLTLFKINDLIRYDDIREYDTFFCCKDKHINRLYSLLMQFSTKPKKIIACHAANGQCTPTISKHKIKYLRDVFGEEKVKLSQRLFATEEYTYAEACVCNVGFKSREPQKSIAWVVSKTGESRNLTCKGSVFSNRLCDEFDRRRNPRFGGWMEINPNADLGELCIFNRKSPTHVTKNIKIAQTFNTPENFIDILKHSLKMSKGVTGTNSLTLEEAKNLCRERRLNVSGKRPELLERLLDFTEKSKSLECY